VDIGITDEDMLLDAHFTATAMANDNFISATNMKNPQVKQIHVEMALQQSTIAKQYHMLGEQLGWMSHPDATSTEQSEAMSTLMKNPIPMNNPSDMSIQNQNRLN
jgi:hypothetical protein